MVAVHTGQEEHVAFHLVGAPYHLESSYQADSYHPCHRLCIVFASSVAVVSVAPAKPVSLSPVPASSAGLVAVGTAASPASCVS